ncbi:MAG: GNA1162 family protein [Deltaproteobacteria bacterium]
MSRWLLLPALALCAAGCAPRKAPKSYDKLLAANPRSILIVPVVNKSVDVDAPAYFLSTIPVPVAERGYYVFPVNMVKRVLEDDGLSDASLVHAADPTRLCGLFGADSVLYVTIERWDAKYVVLSTTVTVEFSYVWKDGKTGEILWGAHQGMTYTPQSGGGGLGGLIAAVINAAMTKAAPSYMPLARQANGAAMAYPGPGFPAGPYRQEYRRDLAPKPGAPPEK